jgi:hypothetical protein
MTEFSTYLLNRMWSQKIGLQNKAGLCNIKFQLEARAGGFGIKTWLRPAARVMRASSAFYIAFATGMSRT